MDYEKVEPFICIGLTILFVIGYIQAKALDTPEAMYEADRCWQDKQEMKTLINDYCFNNSTTNAELRYCKRQLKYKVKRTKEGSVCG